MNKLIRCAILAAIPLAFVLSRNIASADVPTAIGNGGAPRAIYVEEPSLPGLQSDIKSLRLTASAGDLISLKSAAGSLAAKWEAKDALSYLCILSEECDDLTSFNFGFKNVGAASELRDETCEQALKYKSVMGLAMQAYFVEHLNYVPGRLALDGNGRSWPQLRSDRAMLWLETWQEISARTQPDINQSPSLPPLPDRKYIATRIITNGAVDPSQITDPTERQRYATALAKYYSDREMLREQASVTKLADEFRPSVIGFLTSAYESNPGDIDQLKNYLKQYAIDPKDQSLIINSVTTNSNPTAVL